MEATDHADGLVDGRCHATHAVGSRDASHAHGRDTHALGHTREHAHARTRRARTALPLLIGLRSAAIEGNFNARRAGTPLGESVVTVSGCDAGFDQGAVKAAVRAVYARLAGSVHGHGHHTFVLSGEERTDARARKRQVVGQVAPRPRPRMRPNGDSGLARVPPPARSGRTEAGSVRIRTPPRRPCRPCSCRGWGTRTRRARRRTARIGAPSCLPGSTCCTP